ncbi:MAG TPA: hypothetical protein VMN57_15480 [Anaerolineales bacterium]|nr:hypothetical protein [Anaerolineales bacterium]
MDLHILPLHRHEGRDLPDLPGLYVADSAATRRAARSRKGDLLVQLLVLQGTATLGATGQTRILETLAGTYFESNGSVTTGLRDLATQLNDFLLDRNREGAGQSLQATGVYTAFAVRSGQVYTVQSGPGHIFTVHAVAAQHLYDPLLAGQGLGLGRSAGMHLSHAPLDPGDLIILAADPPAAWKSDSLQKAYGRPFDTIHRVLMSAAGEELKAVLIQSHPGKGKIKLLKADQLPREPVPVQAPPPARSPAPRADEGAVEGPFVPPNAETAAPEPVSSLSPPHQAPGTTHHASGTTHPAPTSRRQTPGTFLQPAGRALSTISRAFLSALRAFAYSLRALLQRVLPGNELFTIPPATMAFIAIAVPVIVVVVAGAVYYRRGQTRQYTAYVAKAEDVAEFAETRTDPNEIRISWTAVLDYVDLAEAYQATDETQALRIRAYAHLDPLEGIERLDFQPALATPLGDAVQIVRMAATRDEIYMLDANSGSVIRAALSGRGFEIDTEFKCGSFGNTTYSIGKLIDLATLPQNNILQADIFAMDADGNALYCSDDGDPPVAQAVAPPTSNWGDPRAFVLDSGALYVLDPQTNAVWIYGGADYSYVNPPRLFFDEDIPQMAGVIDFAVDLNDLYMLFADGHLTTCIFGFAGQPTRCTEPAIFTDTRPGKESGPAVEGAVFSQIRFSAPPDPSIYLLDSETGAVFHYSLRLTFQRQFRPLSAPAEPATAFAVSPGRMMFLAYGNEVFWALIP